MKKQLLVSFFFLTFNIFHVSVKLFLTANGDFDLDFDKLYDAMDKFAFSKASAKAELFLT